MTGRAAQKAEAIKLVVLDVDGVMTDGALTYGSAAESESKSFNVKDGLGIKLLQRQGSCCHHRQALRSRRATHSGAGDQNACSRQGR